MKFKVTSELSYTVKAPSTLIFNIHVQRNDSQAVLKEELVIEPQCKSEEITPEGSENRYLKVQVEKPQELLIHYSAEVESTQRQVPIQEIDNLSVKHLGADPLLYLFPSRYCQSDKLYRLASDLFGSIAKPYEKVLAITEWIHKNVEYLSGSTDAQTSAFDTVTERTGVCRDFAHLGIALCRALSIPARYSTGYAYQLTPPDFHACFEAYMGGSWVLFDATKLAPLNGFIKIGNSKDAADASVCSIFGFVKGNYAKVDCQALDNFTPFANGADKNIAICY